MSKITFEANWHGERAAGINSGSETVTIEFANTSEIDTETVEYFREALRDYYDDASILTQEESKRMCSECGQAKEHRNHWAPFGWHNFE